MPSASKQTNQSFSGETVAKVLIYDVESSPNIGYCWGKFEQNIIEFIAERQIISFSWKWLGEKEVHVRSLRMFKTYKKDRLDNTELIQCLHDVQSQATIAIAHNINEFDDKMANTDFLKRGLLPPPPHKTIDTLKVAREKFAFNSNKLDDLGQILGLGRKVKHPGFAMWMGCLAGDPASWDMMEEYNVGDVVLLEKIYLKLRPWMTNHPDMNALDQSSGCPACKSKHLVLEGWVMVGGGRRRRFHCRDCGKWSRGRIVAIEGNKMWKFQ